MCSARGIDVDAKHGVAECVEMLLEWKSHPTAEPDTHTSASPDKTSGLLRPKECQERTPKWREEIASPPNAIRGRGGNINVIALDNSRRLAQVMRPSLADAVIDERRINGNYLDFDDLQRRVHGLGPVMVANLKKAGFRIEARSKTPDDDDDSETAVSDLRMNVSGMDEQVWRHRENLDLYTQLSQPAVITAPGGAEVDHVWECQLINDANDIASGAGGPASRTRAVQGVAKNLFNGVENLNVTTHAVNQSKKGPFTRWRHQRAKERNVSLDDLVRETDGGKSLVDQGHWARISRSVVEVWDELEQRKDLIRAKREREHAHAILREMQKMMDSMKLT